MNSGYKRKPMNAGNSQNNDSTRVITNSVGRSGIINGAQDTGKISLDYLCQFQGACISSKKMNEYLEYIRTIYPNNSSNLGVLMHSKVDETAALELLRKTGYDVDKAKFLITFPTISRQLRIHKCGTNLKHEKLDRVFQRYVQMNTLLHSENEATHFTKILEGIDSGQLKMTFEELSEIITEARSNKYKVPSAVKRLFEDCFHGSRDIEKMLEGSKKMEDLQMLFERLSKLLIPPQNFYRLKEFLEKAKKFEQEILELMTSDSKNVKDMQSKVNSLKVLSLKSTVGDPIHGFKELWEKTHRYLEDIQQIVNPYNTKSNQRKSDFNKTKKILNFFLDNKIQDPKIDALFSLVFDTSRNVNVASLFLNDNRPASAELLNQMITYFEKSKFDMKIMIQKVKQRAEYLDEICHIKSNWKEEDKIAENLSRIEKLKKLPEKDHQNEIDQYEKCLLDLQKIR
jgi:hypothetical protein